MPWLGPELSAAQCRLHTSLKARVQAAVQHPVSMEMSSRQTADVVATAAKQPGLSSRCSSLTSSAIWVAACGGVTGGTQALAPENERSQRQWSLLSACALPEKLGRGTDGVVQAKSCAPQIVAASSMHDAHAHSHG
jgi:hypothetical protein